MQDSKNFSSELFDALNKETTKYLATHKKKETNVSIALSTTQNVVVNYVGHVTMTIVNLMDDTVGKLDYVEKVRAHMNEVLDQVKTKIKTVSLN